VFRWFSSPYFWFFSFFLQCCSSQPPLSLTTSMFSVFFTLPLIFSHSNILYRWHARDFFGRTCKGRGSCDCFQPAMRKKKSHSFSFPMYFYPLLNEGRSCLDVGFSYPSGLLSVYWLVSSCFSRVVTGSILFFYGVLQ